MTQRSILHFDADAFFASVEQAADRHLRNRPVVVGGLHRGIVASASYEAREFGIRTPMPIGRARRMCPKLIIVPPRFELYEQFSRNMFGLAESMTPVIEKQSKTIAAITAVMPVTAPLALWIVYVSSRGETAAMNEFTIGLIIGLIPTFGFAIAAWLAVRAGMKLGPILISGYSAWAIITGLMYLLRNLLGAK